MSKGQSLPLLRSLEEEGPTKTKKNIKKTRKSPGNQMKKKVLRKSEWSLSNDAK